MDFTGENTAAAPLVPAVSEKRSAHVIPCLTRVCRKSSHAIVAYRYYLIVFRQMESAVMYFLPAGSDGESSLSGETADISGNEVQVDQ
jgi:hypothetical protein